MKAKNAISSHSWRPIALGSLPLASRRSYGLGQASFGLLSVMVVDASGSPVPNAIVDVLGGPPESSRTLTDRHGKAFFSLPPGAYDLRVNYKDLIINKRVTNAEMATGSTIFFQYPICALDPLFRPMDLIIFALSGGMIVAGSYWKMRPLEMAGEIAFGAAMFGFIYRLQCL